MTRPLPAAPILALLKHFEAPGSDLPAIANTAAAALEGALYAQSLTDLNDGQYAALIDRVVDMGLDAFAETRLFALVNGGNLTLPVYEFKNFGDRGIAELDVWLIGNSQ